MPPGWIMLYLCALSVCARNAWMSRSGGGRGPQRKSVHSSAHLWSASPLMSLQGEQRSIINVFVYVSLNEREDGGGVFNTMYEGFQHFLLPVKRRDLYIFYLLITFLFQFHRQNNSPRFWVFTYLVVTANAVTLSLLHWIQMVVISLLMSGSILNIFNRVLFVMSQLIGSMHVSNPCLWAFISGEMRGRETEKGRDSKWVSD